MTASDLVTQGCAKSIAVGAIAALKRQAEGEVLSDFEQMLITVATPAITKYYREQES